MNSYIKINESMELLKYGFTKACDLVVGLAESGFELEEIIKILKESKNYKNNEQKT